MIVPADQVPEQLATVESPVTSASPEYTTDEQHPHLLQTAAWAKVKSRHGWQCEPLTLNDGNTVVVLFKRVGPFSIGYVPRGPHIACGDAAALAAFATGLDRCAKRHRALWVLVEPNEPMPLLPGFHPTHDRFQPARTVKVRLVSDIELLAGMHKKTRYNIRLAGRRGVTVRRAEIDEIDVFYHLLQETSERNEFGIHAKNYYVDVLDSFGSNAVMLLAEREGAAIAGLIAACTKDEAIYLYGCSGSASRGYGATAAIQFAAMQWAREMGCERYDLWGIPDYDPEAAVTEDGTQQAGSHGNDMTGLFTFKTGFGGEIVRMPDTMEKVYHPVITRMVRKVVALRRRM